MFRVCRGPCISLGCSYSTSVKPFHQIPRLTLWDNVKFLNPFNDKHLKSIFEGFFLKHGSIVRSRLPGSKYDVVYICRPEDGETLLTSDGQYPVIPGFDFFVAYRNKVTSDRTRSVRQFQHQHDDDDDDDDNDDEDDDDDDDEDDIV